jgi:hypothetical protein
MMSQDQLYIDKSIVDLCSNKEKIIASCKTQVIQNITGGEFYSKKKQYIVLNNLSGPLLGCKPMSLSLELTNTSLMPKTVLKHWF